MKTLALALFMSSSVFAQSVIDAPVDHVFVPAGFDNNDNVELVVTGLFPNPCFKRNDVTVDVHGDVIDVRVRAVVSEDEKSPLCAAMVVPFKEDITVGNLQGGQYKIFINRGTSYELREEVFVGEAASQNQDDHLYAMVSYIELGFTGGTTGSAMLVGWNPSSCMEVDRVEYRSNGKDTLVIHPIMKKVSDFCPMKMTPLNIPVSFNPSEFKHSEVLLMSRTIEGRSVNNLAKMK